MTKSTSYNISQGLEVLRAKPVKAFPVTCKEWEFLKNKIKNISYSINLYLELGVLLLGVALTTLVGIITSSYYNSFNIIISQDYQNSKIISWAIVIVCFICGSLSLFYSRGKEEIKKVYASDIISHMNIIEDRYPIKKMEK